MRSIRRPAGASAKPWRPPARRRCRRAGLTPLDALRAATLAPAKFLGLDAVTGSVAVGKWADLVLLDADPTQDIHNTQRIRAVVLDGRLLPRDALDALLDRAARAQAP